MCKERVMEATVAERGQITLPKAVRTIPDALNYLRQILNPKKEAPLNSLETLFAEIEIRK